jgi:hypothetical protein
MLYIAHVVGAYSYAFVNLGPSHKFVLKRPAGGSEQQAAAAPEPKTLVYPPLTAALAKPVGQCLGRRPTHAMYQVRVMRRCMSRQLSELYELGAWGVSCAWNSHCACTYENSRAQVLRSLRKFEATHGRPVEGPNDLPALKVCDVYPRIDGMVWDGMGH